MGFFKPVIVNGGGSAIELSDNLTTTTKGMALDASQAPVIVGKIPDVSGLAKKSDIPTIPDLSGYAKKTDITKGLEEIPITLVSSNLSVKAYGMVYSSLALNGTTTITININKGTSDLILLVFSSLNGELVGSLMPPTTSVFRGVESYGSILATNSSQARMRFTCSSSIAAQRALCLLKCYLLYRG